MRRGFDLRHPSGARLRTWLDTGAPAGVGEHVEGCERCADRLEAIDQTDARDVADDEPVSLRQVLTELVSPPADLPNRVLRGVERRQRAEREMMLFAGLFSIGVETAHVLLDHPANGQPDDHPAAAGDSEEKDDET